MRRVILLMLGAAAVFALAAIGSRPCGHVRSGNLPVNSRESAAKACRVAIQSSATNVVPSPAGTFLVGDARARTTSMAVGRSLCSSPAGFGECGDVVRRDLPRVLRLTDAAIGTLQSSHIRMQI